MPAATANMRATVECGLEWLGVRYRPRPEAVGLLAPADQPGLDAETVRSVVDAAVNHPRYSIVVPTFDGRRGHPAAFAWQHVAAIRALPLGQGVNAFIRAHGDATLEIPVTDAGAVYDVDTPEDYARLSETMPSLPRPSDLPPRDSPA
jgi:molybdenum cofactor cytidylyltransferase